MNDKKLTIEFERRWALLAGILSVAGVAIYFLGQVYGNSQGSGDGMAEVLLSLDGSYGGVWVGGILQGIGITLLIAPLLFLFKAALARSDRMKSGLVGLVIAGPLFLGIASVLSVGTLVYAADHFEGDSSPAVVKCVNDKTDDFSAGKEGSSADTQPSVDQLDGYRKDCADDEALDLRSDAGVAGAALGFGLAGGVGFAIAVFYTAINAMRVGLLSRFWGSLGMALGVVAILPQLFIFILIWFIYVGLMLAGWVPGGRSPAWASGTAVPWPNPRDAAASKAAADDDVIEGSAEEIDPGEHPESDDSPPGAGPPPSTGSGQIERRKRKKRSS